jgi:outer membrane biosynthesis protein TonB
MRDGLAVSLFGHAALLVWALFSLPSPRALDASQIEAIPVNFVTIADVTSVPKGVATPKPIVEDPKPAPQPEAEPIVEEPPPLPEPEPTPPEPLPPEPEPVAPPPPEPTPPEPTPPEPAPEPTPPEPEPEPQPEPAPEPEPPPAEEPPPAPEPQPQETVEIAPKPKDMPLPEPRPKMLAQVEPKEERPDPFNADKIAALLDKDKAAAEPETPQPSLGGTTSAIDAQMTATELDALRARLAECWSPPIGWTDPSEVRVILMLSLNQDGSVNGEPQVEERPSGRYEQAAPESALRAVRRCAPYSLPPDKYESWKQVRITFDPKEMGGG